MQLLLTLTSLIAVANVATAFSSENDRPVYLCGRDLANARLLVCYGAEYVSKKSFDFTAINDEKWHENWPWVGRRGALSADWTRYKRDEEGLANRCCLNRCTREIISEYC